MGKTKESKKKDILKDLSNKTKSFIKNKNFLLILSLIIIIVLSSLLYYYLVLNKSKCTNGQSSPCSTETSSNNEDDTNIGNSKCVLTQENLELSFQDAKKEINKAIELTKKKKIKVTHTSLFTKSIYAYDPINQTYSGNIEQDIYENGFDAGPTSTLLENVVFKDNQLVYTDQKTGKETYRKEGEFKINPLDYISLNSMEDLSGYDDLEWKAIVKAGDWSDIYTFVLIYQDHDVTVTYEISSSGFLIRYEDTRDSEGSDLYEIEILE